MNEMRVNESLGVNGSLAMGNMVKYDNNSVMSSINSFLGIKKLKSINTYKNYSAWYENFFFTVLGKTIDQLTWKDILKINYRDMYSYRSYLSDTRHNNAKSCNVKMISIRSLWNHFNKRDNKNVDPTTVEIEPLLEDDTVKYGALTKSELDKLFEFCLAEKQKSLDKYYFCKLSSLTAFRKEAVLSLTWQNITLRYDSKSDQSIHILKVKDKGKILEKSLNPLFYEELCSLKRLDTKPTDKILNVSDKTIAGVLNRFCIENNIDDSRAICIHSIKKTAMDIVYVASGYDLVETAKFGNHSSIKYAYENYLSMNRDYKQEFSYTMFDDNSNNLSKLENLNKEQLLKLIKDSGDHVINKLAANIE